VAPVVGRACQPAGSCIKLARPIRPGAVGPGADPIPIGFAGSRPGTAASGRGGRSGPVSFVTSNSKVKSMAKPESGKDKHKDKPKSKPSAQAGQDKPKKPKDKPKPSAEETAAKEVAAAQEKEKAKAAPRPPADPRLKFLKKFHGKFLPRGPLRDRLKVLMERWNSGEDHGGVTVDELKSVYQDWKASREKPARAVKV
jgi:hypothetical protein